MSLLKRMTRFKVGDDISHDSGIKWIIGAEISLRCSPENMQVYSIVGHSAEMQLVLDAREGTVVLQTSDDSLIEYPVRDEWKQFTAGKLAIEKEYQAKKIELDAALSMIQARFEQHRKDKDAKIDDLLDSVYI